MTDEWPTEQDVINLNRIQLAYVYRDGLMDCITRHLSFLSYQEDYLGLAGTDVVNFIHANTMELHDTPLYTGGLDVGHRNIAITTPQGVGFINESDE